MAYLGIGGELDMFIFLNKAFEFVQLLPETLVLYFFPHSLVHSKHRFLIISTFHFFNLKWKVPSITPQTFNL
jgi:hypothetical protein